MPSWLILLLSIAGLIAWTGLFAAGCTGNWRMFRVAAKQFSVILLALATPALLVGIGLFIWYS